MLAEARLKKVTALDGKLYNINLFKLHHFLKYQELTLKW